MCSLTEADLGLMGLKVWGGGAFYVSEANVFRPICSLKPV